MSKSKNIRKKLIKTLKISGIVLVSFGAILYIVPYFFKDTITKGVNELAKEFVKSDVKFEDVNLSFYTHFPHLTVSLENSKIAASSNFPNENFINAKSIALGIDLFSLFGDKITFNELYLSDAEINIKVDSIGNSNYDVFITSNETQDDDSSVNLQFKKINIENTNLLYNDEKNKITFQANQLAYKGLVNFVNNVIDLKAKVSVLEVFLTVDKTVFVDKKALTSDLNTQINLENLSLNFDKSQFVLEKFPFQINGKIDLPENEIDFDLSITSQNSQLVDLFSIVPQTYQKWYENTQIEGTSTLDFSLRGKMNESLQLNPNLELTLKISNGLINYNKSPYPIKNLDFDGKISIPSLNPDLLVASISHFNFKLNEGFAKGNFDFKFPMSLKTNLEAKLDLETLKNASGIDGIDMKGILDLQAKIDGSYVVSTKKVGIRNKEVSYISSIPKIDLESKISNGYFKMKELPIAIQDIFANIEIKNADGVFENTSILINQLKAKASDNYVDGYVKVENLNNYKMETNIKAKLNLADITSIYPVESVSLKGNLDIDFNAAGTYQPKKNIFPVSKSHLKLVNGYIKYSDIPELPIEDINVEMNVTSSKGSMNDLRVEVLPISFKLAGEPFKLDANLYNFNNLTYKINSKGTIDLHNIYKVFAIDGYDLNGLIRANLNISGKGTSTENSNLNNSGYLDLQNIYFDSELFPESFIVKKGKLRFHKEKIILDNLNANYASNNFKISGDISNYINFALTNNALLKGNVTIETNKLNVDEFMVFNSPTSSSSSSSKSTASSGVVLIPENFNFGLNANAKNVFFNGLNLSNFKGSLKVNKGTADLKNAEFDLIGSLFYMTGFYKPISENMAKFDYSIKANDFNIQKAYNEITLFRELASAAKNTYGSVSIDYNLSGVLDSNMSPKLKTIVGNGILTLNDIQFKGFKLFNAVSEKTSVNALHDAKASKVQIKTSIANNVMTIEPTKFKIAGFRPKIQGQVTLDGRMNLGFRLGLPPFGIIGIPMTITGDADNFKIKMGKQKEEQLQETDDDYEAYKKALEEEEAAKKALEQ